MADRTVVVKLKVEDQFSQPVNAYTQKLGQAERATQQFAQGAGRAQTAFAGMGTAITGAIAAFGVMGVARLGEELYSVGMNAQRAEMLFQSFGAQVGSTSALLERLRSVSRGAVDDISLMSAASSMLSMGIAKNGDDVERLTNIAVSYAQAMGTDVASSIQNMNMLISNQSYLRLDQMGIGASQVRQLAEEYRRAGMDSSEAFTAAFLEVAEQKLPQMSAVADATVTALQQLQTSVDNWWTDFGERFAQGVTGMIGLADLLAKALAGVWAAGAPDPEDVAGTIVGGGTLTNSTTGEVIMFPDMNVSGDMIVAQAGYSAQEAAANAQMQAEIDAYYGRGGRAPIGAVAGNYLDLLGGRGTAAAEFESMLRAQAAQRGLASSLSATGIGGFGDISSYTRGPANFQLAMDRLVGQFNSAMMNGFVGGGTGVNLFSPRSVETMNGAKAAMDGLLASAEAMREQGIISEAAVEPFRQVAQWMAQTKGDAESARAALEGMSLSQLFGQQSGGRVGEINGGLLSLLQSRGVDDGALKGLQDALFMNSGQETAASLQFRDDVLPMIADIYEQFGTESAIAAINAYNDAAARAAAVGGLGSTVNLTAALGYTRNGQGGGPAGSYTVQTGDTASAIAARFGVGVGDFGLANPSLIVPGQELTWGSAGGGLTQLDRFAAADDLAATVSTAVEDAATITDEMTTAVDTLAAGIEGVFAKTYQLPVELVVTGGGVLAAMIAAVVNGNGGVVPGSSPNSGRSNAGTRGSANDGSRTRGR